MPVIGLISDTHGLLRPEAAAALGGCGRIIHAGDIGRPEILARLAEIAPVTAVRGNVDTGDWAAALPLTATVEVDGIVMHVIHDLATLDRAGLDPRCRVVISGHSHQPAIREEDGLLLVNPGSAGPRRFRLPITLARLTVEADRAQAALVALS
ncbi:MAG TPA: metallophosphoesterase family protein [Stellaceae bacterium]|jgi:putative phosphoesterase|nr:metallophosphoesterase family protein [Stellaceae bacterium]